MVILEWSRDLDGAHGKWGGDGSEGGGRFRNWQVWVMLSDTVSCCIPASQCKASIMQMSLVFPPPATSLQPVALRWTPPFPPKWQIKKQSRVQNTNPRVVSPKVFQGITASSFGWENDGIPTFFWALLQYLPFIASLLLHYYQSCCALQSANPFRA